MRTINLQSEKLIIDKNTNEPLVIIYDLRKLQLTSLTIEIKEDVKASIVEVFFNGDKNYEFKRVFEIKKNAKLEYLKYQDINKEASVSFDTVSNLEKNAFLNMTNLELGLGNNENYFTSKLNFESSDLNINGLVKLYDETSSSSVFNTIHDEKETRSDIKYKHSLHDKSKAVFEAKSVVNEEALGSKVHQNTNTILLSEDAVIFARPHLEINIDELEASHGATTGSLDKEQLLYLQARGIQRDKANEMLLKAFENEIYDSIQDLKIKEFVENFKKDDYV